MRVKIENILCATDLSDFSNDAIPYGIAMAEEFGAKLLVCHVIEMRTVGLYAEASLNPMELKKRQMDFIKEQFDRLIGDHAVQWESLVRIGYPPDEIVRVAEEYQVDLVVTATHGRSGIKRLILGSVAERLMRALPCPSLVVISRDRDSATRAGDGFRIKRIMVGCDFSPDSGLALQYALSLAQEFQSELHLVHVVESYTEDSSGRVTFFRRKSPDTSLRGRLTKQLDRMVPDEARNWCVPTTVVLEGRSHEELVRYAAQQGIDMIFLGVRGHGVIETYLVGSTTDRVARQSPCPVLTARPMARIDPGVTVNQEVDFETDIDADGDLFSAGRRGNTVIIRLKDNFMHLATDLRARDDLLDYLQLINEIDAIKVVVIFGSPDKTGRDEYFAFYDRIMNAEVDRNAIHRLFNVIDQIVLALVDLTKIVIHADSGKVISLYYNLSLASDYRIVSDETVFQNPCLDMGMIPKGGGPFFLSKMLGSGKAFEILLADKNITAHDALATGLVDKIVPREALEEAALQVAGKFGQKPATSLKGVKRLLNYSKKDLREYLELENQELLSITGSPYLHMADAGKKRSKA